MRNIGMDTIIINQRKNIINGMNIISIMRINKYLSKTEMGSTNASEQQSK